MQVLHLPPPPPSSGVLFFFLTTPHAKNKSALEFIFGEMVPQLIRTKERSFLCLFLGPSSRGTASNGDQAEFSQTRTGAEGVHPGVEWFVGCLFLDIPPHQGHLSVCARVNRSSKSSLYIHPIALCYQKKSIYFLKIDALHSKAFASVNVCDTEGGKGFGIRYWYEVALSSCKNYFMLISHSSSAAGVKLALH